MNTKGVDHIEMILSFVIFVGALATAFTFFHPFSSSPVSSTLLDQIYANVEKRVSTELILVTVVIDESKIDSGKHKFTLTVGRAFPDPWQVKAITSKGIVLKSAIIDRTSGKVEFDWGNENEPFVTLMFAKEITPSTPPVNTIIPGDDSALQFVTLTTRTVLAQKKVLDLRSDYDRDPIGTKTSLGIPPEISYGFQFLSSSGTTLTDVPLERTTDFRIKNKRADALLVANDNLEYSELGVGIW